MSDRKQWTWSKLTVEEEAKWIKKDCESIVKCTKYLLKDRILLDDVRKLKVILVLLQEAESGIRELCCDSPEERDRRMKDILRRPII